MSNIEYSDNGIYEQTQYEEPIEYPSMGTGDNSAEKVISAVAYCTLIIGIIASVIVFAFMFGNRQTQVLAIIYLAVGLLFSFITWASMMVTANISNNIRQIKWELRLRNGRK